MDRDDGNIYGDNSGRDTCGVGVSGKDISRDTCPYCGIRFANPVELIQHVFRYHNS